jgi:hypothetical protein
MDRLTAVSVFKLALIQFKSCTKEPEYIRITSELYKNLQSTHIGNSQAICAQFSQITEFVMKDRLYSCLSNFAATMQTCDAGNVTSNPTPLTQATPNRS